MAGSVFKCRTHSSLPTRTARELRPGAARQIGSAGLLASDEQWKQTPELSEIALIEKTLCDSFDSLHCSAVSIKDLAELAPESWPTLKLKFHE